MDHYRDGRVHRGRCTEAYAVPADLLGGHTAVRVTAADHAVAIGPANGDGEVGPRKRPHDAGEHAGRARGAHHDYAAVVREPADGGAVGGQGVGTVGAADHGSGAKAAAQPASDVLEREQEQGNVLQERELRQVP